jgi:hypothetical protein
MLFDIKINEYFCDSPLLFYLFVQQKGMKTAAPLPRNKLKTAYITETQTNTIQLPNGQNSRGLTP